MHSPRKAMPPKENRQRKGLPLSQQLFFRAVKKWLVLYPGDRVLDALCMDGALLRRLALSAPKVKLCGASFSPAEARCARLQAKRADIMFSGVEDMPWVSESMDVAYIARGLDALEDPPKTINDIARVLKRGGQFVLAYPCPPPLFRAGRNAARAGKRSKTSMCLRSKEDVLALLAAAGFEGLVSMRVRPLGYVISGFKRS